MCNVVFLFCHITYRTRMIAIYVLAIVATATTNVVRPTTESITYLHSRVSTKPNTQTDYPTNPPPRSLINPQTDYPSNPPSRSAINPQTDSLTNPPFRSSVNLQTDSLTNPPSSYSITLQTHAPTNPPSRSFINP